MNTNTQLEIPFHFGPRQDLFGIYHPGAFEHGIGVLLCPPLGQDLIRCHRLYRQLAHALAAAGADVLRFDYYGTGDSAGASEEVEWSRCMSDVATAAERLRLRSGCQQVIAFGPRLGGSLALAASTRARLDQLILWDPVLDGATHVAALDALQAALRFDLNRFNAPRPAAALSGQWQGFAISASFRQQLTDLRLEPPPRRTLLLCSASSDPADVPHRFISTGAEVVPLSAPTPWNDLARLETMIQSHELIDIVSRRIQESAYA
ncbi:Serine aminopeptidase, S33 [Pseudoxanthomonas sp. GM95]|uniref:serine aminopeptidase domain-containing protein n=1 Tax=Pseudoxanthomonas sp. GM95 TaxID=1881043 RepID=UPI0008AE15E8|nr:alpha/beta fold hydrolase [Pseudoxanthomonas sp. GM95]SEL09707.1 Serine aminopeptidase, S33 [Pseudoxanthomonas sp. GM95]